MNMPSNRKFRLTLGHKHTRTIKRRKLNPDKIEENSIAPQIVFVLSVRESVGLLSTFAITFEPYETLYLACILN